MSRPFSDGRLSLYIRYRYAIWYRAKKRGARIMKYTHKAPFDKGYNGMVSAVEHPEMMGM